MYIYDKLAYIQAQGIQQQYSETNGNPEKLQQTMEDSQTVMILTEIRDILRVNNLAQKKTGEHDEVKSEWMLVAMVIDRFMLFTFIIFAFALNVFTFCVYPIYLVDDLDS